MDTLVRLGLGARVSARSHGHNRSTWERRNGGESAAATVLRLDYTDNDSTLWAFATLYVPFTYTFTTARCAWSAVKLQQTTAVSIT